MEYDDECSSNPIDEGVHRVYDGTPEKVSKRKILEITNLQTQPIFRTKRVSPKEDVFLLAEDEVLITHRRISNEQEKRTALVEAFSPEIVVVVEGVFLLQDAFDLEFESLCSVKEFSEHMNLLLHDVVEENPSFSRFCFGFWKTIQSDWVGTPILVSKGKAASKRFLAVEKAKAKSKKRAAIAAGMKLFIAVGDAVKDNNADNAELLHVCNFTLANLEAWVELYEKKQVRHITSHPFRFIGDNVQKAYSGLAVLEYVQDRKEYEVMSPLIKAAIPQIMKAIKKKEVEINARKEERGTRKTLMRSHIMNQLSDIVEELGIQDV